MCDLVAKYEKACQINEQLIRQCYRYEMDKQYAQSELERLKDDVEVWLPSFQSYRAESKMRASLLKCGPIKVKDQPIEVEEAYLLADLERIKASV